MKTLLVIFASLTMFVQHRNKYYTGNDMVEMYATDVMGKKVGNGICNEFVEEALTFSDPDWKKKTGFDRDSTIYVDVFGKNVGIDCYGKMVNKPTRGDICFFIQGDYAHVGILMGFQDSCMAIVDQNSGDRVGENSYVDVTLVRQIGKKIVYFRPY